MIQARINLWLLAYAGTILAATFSGCAMQQPTLYQHWGYQLNTLETIDDVSLLLGSPPDHCEVVEATPRAGLQLDPQGRIVAVSRFSAAAASGVRVGETIRAVDGVSVSGAQEVYNAILSRIKWNEQLRLDTERNSYLLVPIPPNEAKQCYWEIDAGQIRQDRGMAMINKQTGAMAGSSRDKYQRYFRATCRFHDGKLFSCSSNWQE